MLDEKHLALFSNDQTYVTCKETVNLSISKVYNLSQVLRCAELADSSVRMNKRYEPPREKTSNLHMRKQRRRSASQ